MSSSEVEQLLHNQEVVGSNPAWRRAFSCFDLLSSDFLKQMTSKGDFPSQKVNV